MHWGGPNSVTLCSDTKNKYLVGMQTWFGEYDEVAGPVHGNMRSGTTGRASCKNYEFKDQFMSQIDFYVGQNIGDKTDSTDYLVGITFTMRDYDDKDAKEDTISVGVTSSSGLKDDSAKSGGKT
jgi:hypothetical protein